MRRSGIDFAIALVLLAACADRGDKPAGIETAWHVGPRWTLVHELTIGAVEGPGPHVFATIGDIEVAPDGRIIVLERESNEIRIFDASGTHVRTAGRSGSGPGEFDAAHGLEWLPGTDSLLVNDGSANRYSIFDRDGRFVRSMVRPLTGFGYNFPGGVANGLFYEEGSRRVDQTTYESFLVGLRLVTQAVLVDTVSLLKPPSPAIPSYSVQNARGGMYMAVPYTPTQVLDLSEDGALWWGFGSQYRIYQLTLEGDTLREVVVADAKPIPVSPADLQEWERSKFVRLFKERGGVIDFDRIPKHKPLFTDFFVDSAGFLWVDVPTADGRTAFDIFDTESRLLGRVATGIWRMPYVKPLVRNGRLYLVGLDDLTVPFVYVFRIERAQVQVEEGQRGASNR
ncbi:MAG: 6-bladed beta-propeller [Gemmatimonadota bacterium]